LGAERIVAAFKDQSSDLAEAAGMNAFMQKREYANE